MLRLCVPCQCESSLSLVSCAWFSLVKIRCVPFHMLTCCRLLCPPSRFALAACFCSGTTQTTPLAKMAASAVPTATTNRLSLAPNRAGPAPDFQGRLSGTIPGSAARGLMPRLKVTKLERKIVSGAKSSSCGLWRSRIQASLSFSGQSLYILL